MSRPEFKIGNTYIVKKGTSVWSEFKGRITLDKDTEVVLEILRGGDTWSRIRKVGLINVHTMYLQEKE